MDMDYSNFFESEDYEFSAGEVKTWDELTPDQRQSVDGADQADNFLVSESPALVMPVMRLWEQTSRAVEAGHMAQHVQKMLLATGLVELNAKPGTGARIA